MTGVVTVNGLPFPQGDAGTRGFVRLVSPDGGFVSTASIDNGATASYSASVRPGPYGVSVAVYPNGVFLLQQAPSLVVPSVNVATARALNLDVRVKQVPVSGSITVDGQAYPVKPGGFNRGTLFFTPRVAVVAQRTIPTVQFDVPGTGAAAWSVVLEEGTYDVTYRADAIVGPGSMYIVPIGTAGLGPLVVPAGASTLSRTFDLAPVTVSGTVTLNGAQMPNGRAGASWRGNVNFCPVATRLSGCFGPPLPLNGPATYSERIFPGRYDIVLKPDPSAAAFLPQGTAYFPTSLITLRSNQDLTTNQAITSDITTTTVSGAVSVNSQAMQPASQPRGSVILRPRFAGVTSAVPVADGGIAAFSSPAEPGAYDLLWSPGPGAPQAGLPPNGVKQLLSNLTLPSAPLQPNLTVVPVTVTLVRQGPQPAPVGSWGQLVFVPTGASTTDERVTFTVPVSGVVNATLYGGSYDLLFVPTGTSFPARSRWLARNVTVSSGQMLSYPVRVAEVLLSLTKNGQTLNGVEGSIAFLGSDGQVDWADFGPGAVLAQRVLTWETVVDIWLDGANQGESFLYANRRLASALALTTTQSLTFDVPAIQVTANLAITSSPPDSWSGNLWWSWSGIAQQSSFVSVPATLSPLLTPGTYGVLMVASGSRSGLRVALASPCPVPCPTNRPLDGLWYGGTAYSTVGRISVNFTTSTSGTFHRSSSGASSGPLTNVTQGPAGLSFTMGDCSVTIPPEGVSGCRLDGTIGCGYGSVPIRLERP